MGGIVPLGYDAVERKLVSNAEEMKTINYIFESYLEIKSIDLLKEKLNSEEIKTKLRRNKNQTMASKVR